MPASSALPLDPCINELVNSRPAAERARPLRIGVFDSGVGGLSVLRAIRAQLPHSELLYAADMGHAPYGDRPEEFVLDRSLRVARFLRSQGAEIVVVACNTASAAAAVEMRAAWHGMPQVFVEPGIKPAIAASASRRVGVLATTRTLASEKFRLLAQTHTGDATLALQPCPGLADAIQATTDASNEGGVDEVGLLVERYCAPLREAGIDVAVLGCTHYPFARAWFERALPGVTLIDTADAVARQAARLASALDSHLATVDAGVSPKPLAWSSGSPHELAAFARHWLSWAFEVQEMDC